MVKLNVKQTAAAAEAHPAPSDPPASSSDPYEFDESDPGTISTKVRRKKSLTVKRLQNSVQPAPIAQTSQIEQEKLEKLAYMEKNQRLAEEYQRQRLLVQHKEDQLIKLKGEYFELDEYRIALEEENKALKAELDRVKSKNHSQSFSIEPQHAAQIRAVIDALNENMKVLPCIVQDIFKLNKIVDDMDEGGGSVMTRSRISTGIEEKSSVLNETRDVERPSAVSGLVSVDCEMADDNDEENLNENGDGIDASGCEGDKRASVDEGEVEVDEQHQQCDEDENEEAGDEGENECNEQEGVVAPVEEPAPNYLDIIAEEDEEDEVVEENCDDNHNDDDDGENEDEEEKDCGESKINEVDDDEMVEDEEDDDDRQKTKVIEKDEIVEDDEEVDEANESESIVNETMENVNDDRVDQWIKQKSTLRTYSELKSFNKMANANSSVADVNNMTYNVESDERKLDKEVKKKSELRRKSQVFVVQQQQNSLVEIDVTKNVNDESLAMVKHEPIDVESENEKENDNKKDAAKTNSTFIVVKSSGSKNVSGGKGALVQNSSSSKKKKIDLDSDEEEKIDVDDEENDPDYGTKKRVKAKPPRPAPSSKRTMNEVNLNKKTNEILVKTTTKAFENLAVKKEKITNDDSRSLDRSGSSSCSNENLDNSENGDGGRVRRSRKLIVYKEPSLNVKMRRDKDNNVLVKP